jgi:hypothetical protein
MLCPRPLRAPLAALPLLLLALVLACPAALLDAQTPVPPATPSPEALALDKKIIAEAKSGSEIMANLTYLSDVIGPRLTGSAALKQANEWAAEKMRSYGLSNVHLEGWEIPVAWERGPCSLRLVEPGSGRSLIAAAMGWTPSTNGRIEGDVVIVNARTPADLAKYKGKLRGAIVLRGAPTPIRPMSDRNIFDYRQFGGRPGQRDGQASPRPEAKGNEKAAPKADEKAAPMPDGAPPTPRPERMYQEMMAFRREMAEFLRNEGAAVLLMDAGKPHGLLTMTGNWRGGDRVSGPDPLPSMFVAHEHYALLHRLASRQPQARTRVAVEISNKLIPGPVVVHNTVGEIRGSEKPDELVVLGAHLDSWDLAQGTTDNGTGSCVVLEAARILAKSGVRPKRTIRFVLFTGEEQGLHGSAAYCKAHKDEMARTSMALVHDTGTGKVVGLGLQNRASIKPILEAELVSLKELGLTDINLRGMGGSDHMSFERVGVPGFAVQQDPAEYRFSHHSQSDTLDKAKPDELTQGAQVMAIAGLHVANLPDLLPRDKPPEDRPRRNRQGGDRPAPPAAEKAIPPAP